MIGVKMWKDFNHHWVAVIGLSGAIDPALDFYPTTLASLGQVDWQWLILFSVAQLLIFDSECSIAHFVPPKAPSGNLRLGSRDNFVNVRARDVTPRSEAYPPRSLVSEHLRS
jgi:hypothetical protein